MLNEARAAGREQVWLAHAGVFKAALLCRQGLQPKAASGWPHQALDFGRWHLFEL